MDGKEGRSRMRVLTVAMAVVLWFAAPWTAHADFRLHGELSSNLSVMQNVTTKDWTLRSSSRMSGTLEIFPQEQDNIIAVVSFSGIGSQASPDEGVPLRNIFPREIQAHTSYLEVTTPLWYGGPQWLYRFGNQSPRWHSFISRPPESDGIVVSNINIGAWNNQLLYLWGNVPDLVTLGVQTSGFIGGTRVSAAYVSRDSASELAADAHLNLLQNRLQLRVGGAYAEARVHRWEAVSGFSLGSGWRFEHRYRYDERFQPFRDPPPMPLTPTNSHNLRVSTNLLGFNWDVSTAFLNGVTSDLAVRADKNFYIGKTPLGTSYSVSGLHSDRPSYDVGIRTTLDLFDIHRISLRGSIGYTPQGIRWSLGSAYGVPHGFNLDLSHSAQGTTFSAGVRLRF